MKGLVTIACSVAMLTISLASHAQPQDPAIARVDENATKNSLKNPPEVFAPKADTEEATAGFVVPAAPVDKKSSEWILQHKVGPGGEDILMENNMYYFLQDGQRVDVNISDLKDKPKTS